MRLFRKFRNFMYGRNGNDGLNRFLIFTVLFMMLVGAVFRAFGLFWPWLISYCFEWALLVWMLFRFFSKNIYRRQTENRAFFRIKKRIVGFFSLRKAMFRDRKTHIYKKCPGCREVLRLPRRKGHHTVKCCRCGHRFEVDIK